MAGGQRGRHRDLATAHPTALLDEVVGDRGEHVVVVGEQVAPAVGIAVDGELAVAGRHELAHAHRAGIAADQRGDIELLFLAEREQLAEFIAEEQLATHFAFELGRVAAAR